MYSPPKIGRILATVVFSAVLIAGCGGGGGAGGGGGGAPATYSIGGTITGLATSGLVLANGSDTVSPAAGATSFVFAAAVATGSSYAVTIKNQPGNEPCQVTDGSGQVASAAVTNVTVTCALPLTSRFWAWVSGSNTIGATGVYGTQGTAAAGNVPGARAFLVSWTDSAGDLWLFGGTPIPGNAIDSFNDLWRYSPGSSQWTWVSGSSAINASGVYGTLGMPAPGNVPGARSGSYSWIDNTGDLWLFGGVGFDLTGALGYLNDLWRYSPGSGQWTWIGGSTTVDPKGVYGTRGMATAGNVPGARWHSVSWIDNAGDLWLFGGDGYESTGTLNTLNDLWRFSPGSGQWTWVSGSSTSDAQGVYGTQGMVAAGNVPGARVLPVSWTDRAGDLWLFGGQGYDSAGALGYLNDLWRYSPGTGQWTWVGGSNTVGSKGVYGAEGVVAAGNVPGARAGSVSWVDSAGDLWLLGGVGSDSAGTLGAVNDLWRYSPGSGRWTWVGGSNTVNSGGAYGIEGMAAAGNVPGARAGSVSWFDSAGRLWLFGGSALDSTGANGVINDLWVY
jgi:N-acetylneuraminic acid mutarotase